MSFVVDAPERLPGSPTCVPDIAGDKFSIPALPDSFVDRPRLQRVLIAAATSRLTLVVGPIGAGKSTLLANFARSRGRGTTAWCRLDAHDSDPYVFGASVLQAILTARKSAGVDQLPVVRASSPDPLDQAIELAVHGPEIVLVLDDVEQLRTRAGRAALQRLLQMTPHGLSTVLATRHDPDLHHQTLRGAQPVMLRAVDLAFTVLETVALFRRCGVDMSENDALTLTEWTAGSAAALQLAARYLRDGRSRESLLMEARLGDRTVIDHLFNEVLAQQPEELRDFILRTAVVDALDCDLAEAIVESSDAARDLEEAVRQELFLIPVHGADGWYRHHSLIADLLRVTLQHELPAEVPVLHARAARWFEAAGRRDEAMHHAATAGDWDLLARMVADAWFAAALERAAMPARTTEHLLPDELCDSDSARSLAAAIQHLERGEHEDASARLAIAESCAGGNDDDPSRRRLLATLIWLSLACEGTDSAREIDEASTVLEEDADAGCDSNEERKQVARLVMLARAEARLRDGDLDAMSELLERVVSCGPRTRPDTMNSTATTLLALANALGGHLRGAAMLCDQLGEVSASIATANPRGIRSLTLAICSYHADDLAAARIGLAEARVNLRPGVCRDVVAPALAARIAMSDGDKEMAKRQLAHVVATGCTPLMDLLDDALGLVDLAGRRKRAKRARGDWHGDAGHPYVLVRSYLGMAVERAALHEQLDAEAAMEQALALIDRHGYRRAFVDSGLAVRALLVDYVAGVRPFRMLATQLLERVCVDSDVTTARSVERLTERELTVLRYLPTMMSNSEIAAEMYFSVNTVKTHLKSIFRKLDVTRRRQAVERARSLSLI